MNKNITMLSSVNDQTKRVIVLRFMVDTSVLEKGLNYARKYETYLF